MIVSMTDTYAFLLIEEGQGYFTVNTINDNIVLTSSEGGPSTLRIEEGTYEADALGVALQTAINADSTLTGGTVAFDVSYSLPTHKYTIDAGAGNTIAYTQTGSSAGLTLGFTADQAAAQTNVSDSTARDPSDIANSIHDEAERYVKGYCKRTFEETDYKLERYSGNGHKAINLKQYPVINVDRVAVGTINVIEIKNTSTGSSASASVKSTGLRLVLDGTADETILFATYPTITTVIGAVNALGSGWSAAVSSTTYSSFKSTDIVTESAKSCINSKVVYLSIPDEGEYDVEVDYETGTVVLHPGFSRGFRNVFIDYTAGYSATDMPDDLKFAVKGLIQYYYERTMNSVFGIDFYNIGASGSTGLRTIFEKGTIPKETKDILDRYRRTLV